MKYGECEKYGFSIKSWLKCIWTKVVRMFNDKRGWMYCWTILPDEKSEEEC